jgi:hypothetical protein
LFFLFLRTKDYSFLLGAAQIRPDASSQIVKDSTIAATGRMRDAALQWPRP